MQHNKKMLHFIFGNTCNLFAINGLQGIWKRKQNVRYVAFLRLKCSAGKAFEM